MSEADQSSPAQESTPERSEEPAQPQQQPQSSGGGESSPAPRRGGGVGRQALRRSGYAEGRAMLSPDPNAAASGGSGNKGPGAQQGDRDAIAEQAFKGSGREVPHRRKMEQAFGVDLGQVEAFTGPKAQQATKQLGAEAFTKGSRIAFQSDSPSEKTVAHELTHVVQQTGMQAKGGGGGGGASDAKGEEAKSGTKKSAGAPSGAVQRRATSGASEGDAEREAESTAEAVTRGERIDPGSVSGSGEATRMLSLGGAASAVSDAASSVASTASSAASSAYEGASQAAEAGGEALQQGYESARDTASDLYSAAEERAESVEDQLREAVQQGQRAAVQKINELYDSAEHTAHEIARAFPSVPEAFWALMDEHWSSGTGWDLAVQAGAGVTIAGTDIGVPLEVALDGASGVDVSVFRQGKELSLGLKGTQKVAATGVPSVKAAELPIGVSVKAFDEAKFLFDLDRVSWPGGALSKLLAGDLQAAFSEVIESAEGLASNTQVTKTTGARVEGTAGAEIGLDSVAQAVATAGQAAGLKVTQANPTEAKAGKVELDGYVGGFGEMKLELAGGEGEDPLMVKALAQTIVGNINRYLETGGSGEVDIGMRYTRDVPPTEKEDAEPSQEVAIYGRGKGSAQVLGQQGGGSSKLEFVLAMPDVDKFRQSLESEDGLDMEGMAAMAPVSQVNTDLKGNARLRDLMTMLPIFGTVWDEIKGEVSQELEGANEVDANFHLHMEAPKEELTSMAQRGSQGLKDSLQLLSSGQPWAAMVRAADLATEEMADLVDLVKSLNAQVRIGNAYSAVLSTPGRGDITGASGSGEASLKKVWKYSWGPKDLAGLENFLRNLVELDRGEDDGGGGGGSPNEPNQPNSPNQPNAGGGGGQPNRPNAGGGGQPNRPNAPNSPNSPNKPGGGGGGASYAGIQPGIMYSVGHNETAAGIANAAYGEAGYAEAIVDMNKDKVDDPDNLQYGQRLKIPRFPERFMEKGEGGLGGGPSRNYSGIELAAAALGPKETGYGKEDGPHERGQGERENEERDRDRPDQEKPEEPNPGQAYVVVAGDTLSGIAERAYGLAAYWPAIFAVNRNTVDDPNVLNEGSQLSIPRNAESYLRDGTTQQVQNDGIDIFAAAEELLGDASFGDPLLEANRDRLDDPYRIASGTAIRIPEPLTSFLTSSGGNDSGGESDEDGTVPATSEAMGRENIKQMNEINEEPGLHYAHNYAARMRRQGEKMPEDWRSGHAPEQYFDKQGYYQFRLKSGVSASEALQAFFEGPTVCECYSAMVAIQYRTILRAVGPETFDAEFGAADDKKPPEERMFIEMGMSSSNPLAAYRSRTEAAKSGEDGSRGDRPVKPGEWYYVYNHPQYLLKHPAGAYQGENCFFMGTNDEGEQLWRGFGVDNVTETEMLKEMARAYNAERTDRDEDRIEESSEPERYDPEEEPSFPERIEWTDILKAPEFTYQGTTRKGGFVAEAGVTLDEAAVKKLDERNSDEG